MAKSEKKPATSLHRKEAKVEIKRLEEMYAKFDLDKLISRLEKKIAQYPENVELVKYHKGLLKQAQLTKAEYENQIAELTKVAKPPKDECQTKKKTSLKTQST